MDSFQWRTPFAETTFRNKYATGPNDSWPILARRLVEDVVGTRWGSLPRLMSEADAQQLEQHIMSMKFIPGGRYLYYAGRPLHFYNNCFTLRAEYDTREEWGDILKRASDCLMSGGGIGVDYTILRPRGRLLKRTGGISSGPIPLMCSVNEVGRNVMQGGSRRSAIFASLNWRHGDVQEFIRAKDYDPWLIEKKAEDFNFPGQLDMTNISVNFDDDFLQSGDRSVFDAVIKRMVKHGEPGMCFNFGDNSNETLRNACTEFTSEDDSDVCNLGSINLGNIGDIEELKDVVSLASKFLVCGTIRGDVPYEKVKEVRDRNRKIGLGLMGVHEWLLQRSYSYEVTPELHKWLEVYAHESKRSADEHCERFYISSPIKYRAIAPAGTIGIIASTTTGIEPMYAVAYKRRYLEGGTRWKYQYVIDATAERIKNEYGLDADTIETAYVLAQNPEQRVKFQSDVQAYVDMGISSTLNLPPKLSDTATRELGDIIFKYCERLRGITAYPDGARGGQPLVPVDYDTAANKRGVIFDETEEKCAGGICGI